MCAENEGTISSKNLLENVGLCLGVWHKQLTISPMDKGRSKSNKALTLVHVKPLTSGRLKISKHRGYCL